MATARVELTFIAMNFVNNRMSIAYEING